LIRNGQAVAAVDELRDVLARGDRSLRLRQSLGLALLHSGRNEEAIAELKGVVAEYPQDAEAHANLALGLAALGDVAAACVEYSAALDLLPASADVSYRSQMEASLAAGWLSLGHAVEAESVARRAISARPNDQGMMLVLGQALFAQDRLKEASRCFEDLVVLSPRFPEAQNALGLTRLKLGQPREAKASFEAAIRIDPTFAAARANLDAMESLPR
jgi:tetratricopeptide (TPR) repeat protein